MNLRFGAAGQRSYIVTVKRSYLCYKVESESLLIELNKFRQLVIEHVRINVFIRLLISADLSY